MDQDTAKRLFADGGTFVMLGVPEGTEFGIDMKSWNTGERFRGIKMIPPGIHYIFYSAVGSYGEISPRVGFFHNFRKSELLVKKWDKEKEDISSEEVSESEVLQLRDNILALDKFLGPYPFDISEKWNNLSTHLTETLIKNLSSSSGYVRSALELMSCKDEDRPRAGKTVDGVAPQATRKLRPSFSYNPENDLLPDLKAIEGTALRLNTFPERNYPEGSTAAEITKHHLDNTYVLEVFLKNYTNPIDIIGELEFAYICFLVGHSLEAFEHWKKLVVLLCSCETAIKKYRAIYDDFITLLEEQVREIPEEFLADIVANNNFVYVKLRNLFRAVMESSVDGILKTKIERFRDQLTEAYLWDFTHLDEEDEEDLPVVVDMSA
ncbi:PREDICTED: protein AAR2 homolog [Nicrophorus vespilloides]|uniref:Protein AAR2 homolog n=1 Tax=Nicrophorus vespilloides TaxID=110193 RepID=A0ABM1N9M5_NICVS|nr:PREDICTED: protein AAR2 homolog [Nicrophorus vespilloides]